MATSKSRSNSIYGTSSLHSVKNEGGNLLYYILMALLVFALLVGIIFLGGMLRFTLAIFILFLIGFNLFYWSIEETENSEIWRKGDEFDEEVNLKLKEDSALVRRAFKGMEMSQGYLEKKIRDLFLDKLMESRNLSSEEIEKLLHQPDEIRHMVDDEILSDFILSKLHEDERSSLERLSVEEYERWISTLLKRIEVWEKD